VKTGVLIESNAGTLFCLNGGTSVLSNGPTLPTFDVLAYTGGMVQLDALPLPVVFDLSTTEIPNSVPALFKHNHSDIVGHCENVSVNLPDTITAKAVISGSTNRANEITNLARNGYQWQVSVGLVSTRLVEIQAGKTVSVNNQTFTGPLFVAYDNQLREISFVSIGADPYTYANLVASLRNTQMSFEQWLASLQIDGSTLTDIERAFAQKIYDAMQAANAAAPATATATTAEASATLRTYLNASAAARRPAPTPTPTPTVPPVVDPMVDFRNRQASEVDRINAINAAGVEFGNPSVNGVTICANAIRNGWDVERTRTELELHRLRNQRPQNLNAGGRNGGGNNSFTTFQMLECALAQSGRLPNIERQFAEPLLQATHTRFRSRIGLQEMLYEAALAGGYTGSPNVKANLKAILQAAFSTFDLPNIIVSNVNRYMVAGFKAVDESWRAIAKIGSRSDFKEMAGYRGIGSFRFDKLPPSGQIKHGTVSETAYGNKVDTFAKMIGITRETIINDDMGYLADVPRQIGRGGALSLVHTFWTEFMDNSTFFASGNNNVTTGALSIANMNVALTKFRKQTDEAGDYVMATPVALVVPVELEETANQLYTDTNRGGGNTGDAETNPHKGKYPPIVSPYLSDTRFTGNSTTAYYLIADPNDIPVIEVVFLDGNETPIVETADANFSQLGIEIRGYYDFGVRKQEFRGGVRSTGA